MSTQYLFIDGEYLDAIYKDMITDFFGKDFKGALDVKAVAAGYQKVYYYNALEDEPYEGETAEAMQERIKETEARFEEIASYDFVHTRLGTVSGKRRKKRRQKQVDVQLAVDMLTHGFHHNMQRAVLLAGDLDFKPVLESLVGMGITTVVSCEKRSASRYLCRAADIAKELTLNDMFQWSTPEFRTAYEVPIPERNSSPPYQGTTFVRRHGIWNSSREIELLESEYHQMFILHAIPYRHLPSLHVRYPNYEMLEQYFTRYFGPIMWKD